MKTELLLAGVGLFSFAFAGCASGRAADPKDGAGVEAPGSTRSVDGPSAPATTSAVAVASTSPPSPEADFIAVASLPYDVHLGAHRDVLFAWSTEPRGDIEFATPMGIVEGDRFLEKEELKLPATFMMEVNGMGGAWPTGLDLLLTSSTGRTPIAEHFVLSTTGWSPKSRREGKYFVGIAEVGQSVVAMEMTLNFPIRPPKISTLRGPAVERVIAPPSKECQDRMVTEGATPGALPVERVSSNAFGATRAGALLSVGSDLCATGSALEVWDPEAKTSKVLTLSAERPRYDAVALVTRGWGDKDAFISYGAPYYFDGAEVKPLPKLPDQITHLAPGKQGVLFALTLKGYRYSSTKVTKVHRLKDGAWTEVLLSTPPVSLASDESGTVWLDSAKTLFRTRRSSDERSTVELPSKETTNQIVASDRSKPLRPAGPVCANNVVVLYGFTKVTPDDYDFPLTRKALKGHTEFAKTRFVVARDGGQKFFTALVPDVSTGRKLVSLVEKDVQGSKPQLLCANPEILRELTLDLKTGELVK